MTLKDKMKLAEDVLADYLTHTQPGLVSIMAAASSKNAEKAKNAIVEKLDGIRKEGIGNAELVTAKKSLLGQYAFRERERSRAGRMP